MLSASHAAAPVAEHYAAAQGASAFFNSAALGELETPHCVVRCGHSRCIYRKEAIRLAALDAARALDPLQPPPPPPTAGDEPSYRTQQRALIARADALHDRASGFARQAAAAMHDAGVEEWLVLKEGASHGLLAGREIRQVGEGERLLLARNAQLATSDDAAPLLAPGDDGRGSRGSSSNAWAAAGAAYGTAAAATPAEEWRRRAALHALASKCLLRAGQKVEAEAAATLSIDADGGAFSGWLRRGSARFGLGWLVDSLDDLITALRLHSDDPGGCACSGEELALAERTLELVRDAREKAQLSFYARGLAGAGSGAAGSADRLQSDDAFAGRDQFEQEQQPLEQQEQRPRPETLGAKKRREKAQRLQQRELRRGINYVEFSPQPKRADPSASLVGPVRAADGSASWGAEEWEMQKGSGQLLIELRQLAKVRRKEVSTAEALRLARAAFDRGDFERCDKLCLERLGEDRAEGEGFMTLDVPGLRAGRTSRSKLL